MQLRQPLEEHARLPVILRAGLGLLESLANVGEPALTLPSPRGKGNLRITHPPHQGCCLFGRCLFALVSQRGNHRVWDVAPEQVRRHAVGHAQRPGQHRPFVLFDLHQVLVHQGSARRQTAPGVGAARWQTAQLQPKSDARAAPGDIILQIAVEALKTRVDIRRHRDEH